MRLLVITSCTGEKSVAPKNSLTLADFQKGKAHVRAREQELKQFLTPAREIYTGEQHLRLMRGLSVVRGPVVDASLFILSAGYGLIPEDRKIAPYECTFDSMKSKDLRTWGTTLNVPADFRATVAKPYDLTLVLLGKKYLQACLLGPDVKLGGLTLLFCGQTTADKISRLPNLHLVILSNADTKRFSCGQVGLDRKSVV